MVLWVVLICHSVFLVFLGSSPSQEMVALLVQAGLFDTAISLCQTFKLPLTPVFEGLSFKYVTSYCAHPAK